MKKHQQIRLGLVGAGAIAQTYAQAIPSCQAAKLTAVADARPEAAQSLAEKLNVPGFDSYQHMAESVELDAVIVCTPPATHAEICEYFLQRKVAVLCEKPLAIDRDSARSMIATAQSSGALLTMASKFRFVQDVFEARQLINSGLIGEVVLFENTFASCVDMSARWNSDPLISGGGVLIDNGTHSVDIMRYLFGPVAQLQAVEVKRIQDIPVEDSVRLFVRTQSGVTGNIDLSWSLHKEQPYYVGVYGSRGTLLVGWQQSQYRVHGTEEWISFGQGYDKVQAFCSQIDNFSRAVQGKEELVIGIEDAMASVEVIEAAYDSLWKDSWITVEASGKAATDTSRP